jgi:nuclear transcription Y subunit beta
MDDAFQYFNREPNRLLPVANIFRVMKLSLPEGSKVSKDAKEIVQECVSEFIAFITSEASDRLREDKRRTSYVAVQSV